MTKSDQFWAQLERLATTREHKENSPELDIGTALEDKVWSLGTGRVPQPIFGIYQYGRKVYITDHASRSIHGMRHRFFPSAETLECIMTSTGFDADLYLALVGCDVGIEAAFIVSLSND